MTNMRYKALEESPKQSQGKGSETTRDGCDWLAGAHRHLVLSCSSRRGLGAQAEGSV